MRVRVTFADGSSGCIKKKTVGCGVLPEAPEERPG